MRTLGFKLAAIGALCAALAACSSSSTPIDIPQTSASVDCAASSSLNIASDPSAPGPWAVGAKTVTLTNSHGQALTTEVWYPSAVGSEAGSSPLKYDLRQFLNHDDATKLADVDMSQPCDCYANLPLDSAHGPYPVILFLHGSGSFRTASLSQALHWASRGFVVLAADYPALQLKDFKANPLASLFEAQANDSISIIKQLHTVPAALAFLTDHIDTNRIGVAGHSMGGVAAASLGDIPGVRVIIPMAAGGVESGNYLRSSLVMGAVDDKVARFNGQQMGYSTSPKPKRFLALENAGHLAFTDICGLLPEQGGLLGVAKNHGISVPWYMSSLGRDGCGDSQMPAQMSSTIINYATTATFEETLQCRGDASAKLAETKALFPGVKEFKETLRRIGQPLAAANNF